MKIVADKIDKKSLCGSIVLVCTCPDDLYVLSSIVAEGDAVEAVTTRKLSLDGGKTQQKIVTRLAVRVETADFDLEDGIMSVKGKICRENEHVQMGTYHTLHVSLDEKFELTKKKWSRHSCGSLVEATREVPGLCFVVFYDRECVVSSVSPNSIKNLYKGEIKNKNYKPVTASLAGMKGKAKAIVVASFSTTAEEFCKALVKEDRSMEKQVSAIRLTPEYKNIPNARVVSRLLTDRRFAKTFSEIKYVDDLREVEDFFLEIQRGGKKTCVGFGEVREALEYGAIKTLFITDALYRPRTVEERRRTEEVVNQAAELRAKICVIPVIHESGEKLKAMGGIAGNLQFTYR